MHKCTQSGQDKLFEKMALAQNLEAREPWRLCGEADLGRETSDRLVFSVL